MTRNLSVILVTYNSGEVALRAIRSVYAQDLPQMPEVIVVDNASSDGSADRVAAEFPDVNILHSDTNRGFAWANNRGIDAASGDFILLLNDDAWLENGCASRLMDAMESNPNACSASPRIYRNAEKGVLDSTGIVLNKKWLRPYDRGEGESAGGNFLKHEEIFGATGACAIFRKDAIDALKVDGEVFDEDFFAYYEDVDLAWRAQVLGFSCLYVPDAEAFHERRGPESKPSEIKKYFLVNRYFCYVKNEACALAWRYLPFMIPIEAARFIRRLISEPYLSAAVPLFFRLLPRMRVKRRWIQARRKASSKRLRQFL